MLNTKVKNALTSAIIEEIDGTFHLKTCQMARQDYKVFAKVTASLRGEWVRSADAHIFLYDPTQRIAKVLESGQIPDVNPFDFFPTPTAEIDWMIDWIELPSEPHTRGGIKILEPQAGDGRIARMIRDRLPTAQIDCYEVDPFNRELLTEQGFSVKGNDFLAAIDDGTRYDYIIMNPPFDGKTYQGHIRKAFSLLGRDGVLTSIVPHAFCQDKVFRNFVFERGDHISIGSPFESTKTHCAVIKMENYDHSWQWQPDNCGFESRYHHNVQIAIDSEALFWSEIEGCRDLASLVDAAVERLITKENCSFYWDGNVKASVLRYLLTEDRMGGGFVSIVEGQDFQSCRYFLAKP